MSYEILATLMALPDLQEVPSNSSFYVIRERGEKLETFNFFTMIISSNSFQPILV